MSESANRIAELEAEVERLRSEADTLVEIIEAASRENDRLQGIIAQHNLCHDLHGKVNAEDFAKGCEAEQRRIYGCAPHADEVERLQGIINNALKIQTQIRG